MYDTIIIGGACAGLSAGLYTARRALKTLILTKDIGGQAAITTVIENYPGTGDITGPELANKFKEQAVGAGAEIQFAEVTAIEKRADNTFQIKTNIGDFQSATVILAFGLEQRKLGVPGEKELTGRGVAYCATCDGPLYRNKVVAVVGGGNSAFDAADYLAQLASRVYLLVRSENFRAENTLIEVVKSNPKIEIHLNTEITEVIGEKRVEKVRLVNNKTQEKTELELNGVFIETGWQTKTEFVKDLVKLNEKGSVVVDNQCQTSMPGVFAAGDVTDTPFKQAVISAGEGAKAGLSAAKYLQALRGGGSELGADFTKYRK
jgi:thioredoxin-disulfide reductase